jgi:hypothetical protein
MNAEVFYPNAELAVFSEEELGIQFDELIELSASQPDDELAMQSLRAVVVEARDRGYIDTAMQMAVTLGATACLHPHMEGLADSVGESLGLFDDHNPSEERAETGHDASTCADCRAGKPCSKKQ